jgi:hypothetical protein
MKRHLRLWLGIGLVVVGGSVLSPAVHWRLLGWAKGEAFYQGRPTSYWLGELRKTDWINFAVIQDPKPSWAPEFLRPLWGDWVPGEKLLMGNPDEVCPVFREILPRVSTDSPDDQSVRFIAERWHTEHYSQAIKP